ncbi:protein SCO1/2 [Luteibacter sp. OK325]|uniref:SCO family protein n=1 Tax=Luteibacter sp. OK325 TaxID=2135670 RepID=UPI000D3BF8E2|nr:SCO family protein [Luteibacter sp. OK325]PTR33874.1 protein SCO1/2 [Luteibacter sp. OK325]
MRRLSFVLFAVCLVASGVHAASPTVGGSFQLTDQDGHAVTQSSFAGRPLLLYFGYTSCPDICPVDLAKIVKIAGAVREASGVTVTPVFVTIDPERDTPARLQAYVRAFGKDVVGLTGTTTQIGAITDEYHVYFKKVPVDGGYLMDHSTMLFLVGANGAYLDHYGRKLPEEDVVKRVVTTLRGAG